MTDFWAWLNGLGARRELALWVAISVLLHTLGALLAWRSRRWTTDAGQPTVDDGWLGNVLQRLRRHWSGPLLLQLVRFAYFLGLPYALLIRRGVLELQPLGLLGPADLDQSVLGWGGEWLIATGRMVAVGLAGALVVLWGRANLRWVMAHTDGGREMEDDGVTGPIVRETIYLQVHWAFYRTAPLLWLGAGNEGWAAFAGVGIVALEAALDPRFWAALGDPDRAIRPLFTGVLCWLSALGFALTRNLWLVAAIHMALVWGSQRRLGRALPAPQQAGGVGDRASAQEEAQDDQRAEDQRRQQADTLQVADDVLVFLTSVRQARRRSRAGAEAGAVGRGRDLRPDL